MSFNTGSTAMFSLFWMLLQYQSVLIVFLVLRLCPPFIEARNLTLCLMVERGSTALFYNFDRSAAAVDLALEYANDVMFYKKNIRLNSVYTDIGSTCPVKNHIVSYAMDLMNTGVNCDVYIGPGCGSAAESLYDFASAYRTLIIGCPAAGVGAIAPLLDYPFLSRISITHLNTARILLMFLRQQNYASPAIIQDWTNSFYQQMSSVIQDYIFRNAVDIYRKSSFVEIKSAVFSDKIAEQFLRNNYDNTRVFILLAPSNTVRITMLTARKLGMTNGEFIYLAVNLFPSVSWGNFSYSHSDSDDENARDAYQSLLIASISTLYDTSYTIFAEEVKKLSKKKYNFTYAAGDQVDIITSHFYDAVIYYASMINSLMAAGSTTFNGDDLVKIYPNYRFVSAVNGQIAITSSGDRISYYVLQSFNPDRGRFESFRGYSGGGNSVVLGNVKWITGDKFPPNIPFCGFTGTDPKCAYVVQTTPVAVGIAIPIILIIAGICVGTYYASRFMTAKSDSFWWRIFVHELGVMGTGRKSTVSEMESQNIGETTTLTSIPKTDPTRASPYSIKKAVYDGGLVGLTDFQEPLQRVSMNIGKILLPIRQIQHPNMQKFFGIAVNDDNLCECVVGELCSKGTLTRLLERDRINLDWNFKSTLMKDLTSGMLYLHSTKLISHGNLSSHTCLIDSNFVLKICDYGLEFFRSTADLRPLYDDDYDRDLNILFWRAPELLRQTMPPSGTQKGDIYSYSIVLQQIIMRSPPYRSSDAANRNTLSDTEILLEIKKGSVPPLRPRVPTSLCPQKLRDLLDRCWDEIPAARPSFTQIKDILGKLLRYAGENIVDHLIKTMERHAIELEREAEQRMQDFMDEKRRSDDILSQMLPKAVATDLANGRSVFPETYPSTTVHFSDVEGFAELISESKSPRDTIYIMNSLYATCDAIIARHDVYKVESVKDQLMIVSGLPVPNGILHAGEIASLGLTMMKEVAGLKLDVVSTVKLKLRVGNHSGPCVAGVIGTKMPRYCLFGDTVNTSSRMESHGEAGKIQCSRSTKDLLEKLGGFLLISRGEINVKGKEPMATWWIIGKENG